MNESLAWLKTLDRAQQRAMGEAGLVQMQAVLAGVAPGALKNGSGVLRRIQQQFRRLAGL